MTDLKFNAVLKEYRPANWTNEQFKAACEQASDNNTCESPISSDEWLEEFESHLADIVEGRIPNTYWRGA